MPVTWRGDDSKAKPRMCKAATPLAAPSEAMDSDSQGIGQSRKRKRTTTKSTLDFDQLPPAVQKRLLKQAQKEVSQAKDVDDADEGTVFVTYLT